MAIMLMLTALATGLTSTGLVLQASAEDVQPRFVDVPSGHWAETYILSLRALGVTDGIGDNRFGMGLPIRRSEFVTFLARLMGWQDMTPAKGSFTDNQDASQWFYPFVETAVANDVVDSGGAFRPGDPITRAEMAVMIVRALGYHSLADSVASQGSPFADVTANQGAISVAASFGIVNGMDATRFAPDAHATREQAAAMMIRMYGGLTRSLGQLHAFYAISSYGQMDKLSGLDSVSFGWSRLDRNATTGEIYLNTDKAGSNEYGVPDGYEEPLAAARSAGLPSYLMVAAQNAEVLESMLSDEALRRQTVQDIVAAVTAMPEFDGAVIDFEGLSGTASRQAFTTFIQEVGTALHGQSKKLLVAVPPARKTGQAYYDAYDFRAIGAVADTVILMAHDYEATSMTAAEMASGWTVTPLTPFDEVWHALSAITNAKTGVADKSKVLLQFSFDSVVWSLENGKVIDGTPDHLGMDAVVERLEGGATIKYSELNRNPVATWLEPASGGSSGTEAGASEGVTRVMWYEDARSIADKMRLARLFGIGGVSLWRLGTIPDVQNTSTPGAVAIHMNVWDTVLELMNGK